MDTFVVKEQEWQILQKAEFGRPFLGLWALITFALV